VTGQDGSHLSDFLLTKPDYTVVGVARRTSNDSNGRIKHILNNSRFNLIEGDITDAHSVIHILQTHDDVDEVYNLAAQSHVAVSFKQPALTWDITGKGCLNILQSLVDLSMTHVKFYQASSSEMFGKNYEEYVDDKSDLPECYAPRIKYQDEDTKFMPQSPYAIAKCAAHYMTILCREAYGMFACAGILFNHEGPRRGETFVTRKITKWIGEFQAARSQERYTIGRLYVPQDMIYLGPTKNDSLRDQIYLNDGLFPKLRLGNLEAFRDWGYAGDYVEAMWMMLQQDSPEDFVICTGETHTIREFLDVAFSHIGIEDWSGLVIQDPAFYRPADVDFLRGDSYKAKTKLGWAPKCSFEELVKLMVDHDIQVKEGQFLE